MPAVAPHLRLTLFCARVYSVFTLEGRAWAVGGKDDIDLDMENLQELVDLGILAIHPTPQTGGRGEGAHRVYSGGDRFGTVLEKTFNETFEDGDLPQHPGLWAMGDMTEIEVTIRDEGRTVTIPAITSAYGETLGVHGRDLLERITYRYRTGEYVGDMSMNGSMLAILRCVMEHDVYSAGHVFVNRLDGGKPYQGALDSSGLYALIRFGLVRAKGVRIEKWAAEHYEATDHAQAFYDLAFPHLGRMARQDRWEEIATIMGWNQ